MNIPVTDGSLFPIHVLTKLNFMRQTHVPMRANIFHNARIPTSIPRFEALNLSPKKKAANSIIDPLHCPPSLSIEQPRKNQNGLPGDATTAAVIS
jgi:hypothetical protein